MINIIFWIYIFLDLLGWFIFLDVILSWLAVFGLNIRPKFLADIIDPIYSLVKKNITTTISMLDFTPIVVLLIIYLMKLILLILFPELVATLQNYNNIL